MSLIMASVNALEVEVQGDISLDVKINDRVLKERVKSPVVRSAEMKANENVESSEERERRQILEREKQKRLNMVTAAAAVECVYQYPERKQVEAMLSNMMNQLAKVYVRVREFVTDGRRRATETRFRVVSSTNLSFFDEIYANMTNEYRNLYNNTTSFVPRTSDPCASQPQLKGVWHHLLESSVKFLRVAVARSVGHFLKLNPLSRRKRSAVQQLVESELARIRGSQLDTLCDDFQLCFNELL